MGIKEILALILKWLPLVAQGLPGAIAEVQKLMAILDELIGGFGGKKPTQEQIDAVRASSKALTDAINATP